MRRPIDPLPGVLLLALVSCNEAPIVPGELADPDDISSDPADEPIDWDRLVREVKVTDDAAAYLADADEPLTGFGAATRGAGGGQNVVVVHVTEPTDRSVRDVWNYVRGRRGSAVIAFDVRGVIAIHSPLPVVDGAFITIEGNGVTLDGTRFGGGTSALLDIRGHDIIVRHLRLRNAGDNLRAQGPGAYNIVFSHISSTGARDDGISIGYGAHDITVQYCFLAGNTRSLFIKYNGTTRVSVHHNWIMKQWIRGPLIYQALVDLRNNIIEDWTLWGARFEGSSAAGNAVANHFLLGEVALDQGGKATAALFTYSGAQARNIYTAGNSYAGHAIETLVGQASAPLAAPAVPTAPVAEMLPITRGRAGCMPRDTIDQAYIDARRWRTGSSAPFRGPF